MCPHCKPSGYHLALGITTFTSHEMVCYLDWVCFTNGCRWLVPWQAFAGSAPCMQLLLGRTILRAAVMVRQAGQDGQVPT